MNHSAAFDNFLIKLVFFDRQHVVCVLTFWCNYQRHKRHVSSCLQSNYHLLTVVAYYVGGARPPGGLLWRRRPHQHTQYQSAPMIIIKTLTRYLSTVMFTINYLLHCFILTYPANIIYLNFQSLDVVSRYRDHQHQVAENYLYLVNLRPYIRRSWCFKRSSRSQLQWFNRLIKWI